MTSTDPWDAPLEPQIQLSPDEPLSAEQINRLWEMFHAIATHWDIKIEVELLRSRWLDMLEARCAGVPDYRGEYANAAEVYTELLGKLGAPAAIDKLYRQTVVTDAAQAITRLTHAKFYVANDFIRCFVATGGFRGFVPKTVPGARNYTGYMGGSRFREWDPVRTGKRK